MTSIELKKLLLETELLEDNKYLDDYCELCLNNLMTKKQAYKTNSHHVIPVAFYRIKYNKSDRKQAEDIANKDEKNFRVNLLFRDHLLAHYYLAMSATTNRAIASMTSAIEFLSGHTKLALHDLNLSEDELTAYQVRYEKALREKITVVAHKNTGKKRSEETRKKQSIALRGKSKSLESRQRMSEAKKGTKLSTATKIKISNANKGKKQPWAGRKQSQEEIEKRRQKLIGHTTSEETRKKISEANKGRKISDECRQKIRESHLGKSSWNKGLKANNAGKVQVSNLQLNTSKYINKECLEEYLLNGWVKGNFKLHQLKKGKSSNTEKKILCIETDEVFNSLKEASSNRGCSCLNRSVKDINVTTNKCHWVYLKTLDNWLKIDLKVVGFQEGTNKYAGTLGALVCEYKYSTVDVGSGFSDALRDEIWANKDAWLGKIITVKYFEETYNSATGLPSLRFPVFIRVREDA